MRIRGDTLLDETATATSRSADIVLDFLPRLAIQCRVDAGSPAAQSFPDTAVDIVQDYITLAAHGYALSLKGQFTTTGTLPGGISPATDYFIIPVGVNIFRVATSRANAEAGTYELLNSQGTGTHTFTPTAFSGGEWKLMSSNDQTNFVDLPSCIVTVTTSGTTLFNVVEPAYRFLRLVWTPANGQAALGAILNGYSSYAITE